MEVNVKKILLLIVIFTVVFSSCFSIELEAFLKKIYEQYPDAVAAELGWQSAFDTYNATLLKADSKLSIIEADLDRLKAYKTYMDEKWDVLEEVLNILFELEKTDIESGIADIENRMYSEDLENKKKASSYGGVSDMEVSLAEIEADLSQSKLDYYKNYKSEMGSHMRDVLFISELPELQFTDIELRSLTVEEISDIKGKNIERQIESLTKQVEETKYKLAQTGMTTSYLADVNKRAAKIHELREQSVEYSVIYEINIAHEKVKLAIAQYNAALAKKELYMDRLVKLQEAQKEGYITSYDYYQGVLTIYEYDRMAWQAKHDLFLSLLEYLKARGEDPVEGLLPYFEK